MARIRSIKPEFFLDEDIASLSPMARLLFIGLWTLADRDGRLEDRPKRIKASLFPYDGEADVERLLAEVAGAGLIQRYEVDGEACISIPGFAKHQRPHPKETSFGLPAPTEPCLSTAGHETPGTMPDASRRVPVVVGSGSGNGSGNGSSASQEPDASAPVPEGGEVVSDPCRPPLVLTSQPSGKKSRRPSAGEALYEQLEQERRAACEAEGVPFAPERWPVERINAALGKLARLGQEEPGAADVLRFTAAWEEYLNDPKGAQLKVPYSLGYFLSGSVRAEYEVRAERAAVEAETGGAP